MENLKKSGKNKTKLNLSWRRPLSVDWFLYDTASVMKGLRALYHKNLENIKNSKPIFGSYKKECIWRVSYRIFLIKCPSATNW